MEVTERVFDRIPSIPDPVRKKNFSLRKATVGVKLRSYTWAHVQLDQGDEGACTGFGPTMEAAARPVPVWGDPKRAIKSKITATSAPFPVISELNKIAREAYYNNRRIDEWPGENYEGSSVAAGMKTGTQYGWWDRYLWAESGPKQAAQEVFLALSKGPVIMGSDWLEGMMPDANGYLNVTGAVLGGHCYLVTAFNIKRDAMWTPNSWGGQGQGWITRAGLEQLFERGAEAAFPVQRHMPAPT